MWLLKIFHLDFMSRVQLGFSRKKLYHPCWGYRFFFKMTPLNFQSNLPWTPWSFPLFCIDPNDSYSTPWNFPLISSTGCYLFFLEKPISSVLNYCLGYRCIQRYLRKNLWTVRVIGFSKMFSLYLTSPIISCFFWSSNSLILVYSPTMCAFSWRFSSRITSIQALAIAIETGFPPN